MRLSTEQFNKRFTFSVAHGPPLSSGCRLPTRNCYVVTLQAWNKTGLLPFLRRCVKLWYRDVRSSSFDSLCERARRSTVWQNHYQYSAPYCTAFYPHNSEYITFNFPSSHPHFLTVTIVCGCCLRTLDVHYWPLLFYDILIITALGMLWLSIVWHYWAAFCLLFYIILMNNEWIPSVRHRLSSYICLSVRLSVTLLHPITDLSFSAIFCTA